MSKGAVDYVKTMSNVELFDELHETQILTYVIKVPDLRCQDTNCVSKLLCPRPDVYRKRFEQRFSLFDRC
jgi:hypothetical protein